MNPATTAHRPPGSRWRSLRGSLRGSPRQAPARPRQGFARPRQALARRWRLLRHRGDAVECPLCGSRFSEFAPDFNRWHAKCWRCGSHERHRGLWLHLQRHPELLAGVRSFLHVSPEWCLERRLRPLIGPGYRTSELEPGRADLALDLTAADLPDASFDAILCSHVLEHIPDDRAAMRELHRLVRPGGWAIVMVPIDHSRAATYEDAAIRSAGARLEAFWQVDHVRLYAPDIADRLAAAGFEVETARPAVELGREAALRYGLLESDDVLVCRC